jgi:flagellar assembly protein FliH
MPGIIKSNGSSEGHAGHQAVAFNFEDMSQRAQQYLEQVKQQAEAVLKEAQNQAEQIRVNARVEGREQAMQQARQESHSHVEKQMQSVMPAVESAINDLVKQRDDWESHWEHQAVTLAIKIAEKIIRRELNQDPEIGKTWIRQALELISRQEQVTIELSPGDLESIQPQIEVLSQSLGRLAETHVVTSPQLQPGECRVLTRHGQIDQRLETQLDRIQSELA